MTISKYCIWFFGVFFVFVQTSCKKRPSNNDSEILAGKKPAKKSDDIEPPKEIKDPKVVKKFFEEDLKILAKKEFLVRTPENDRQNPNDGKKNVSLDCKPYGGDLEQYIATLDYNNASVVEVKKDPSDSFPGSWERYYTFYKFEKAKQASVAKEGGLVADFIYTTRSPQDDREVIDLMITDYKSRNFVCLMYLNSDWNKSDSEWNQRIVASKFQKSPFLNGQFDRSNGGRFKFENGNNTVK